MAKHKRTIPTLWEVPDQLWERAEPLLKRLDPPADTGRPPVDRRRVLDAIIFRLRAGCQWNHIPRVYGDDSTIFRCSNIGATSAFSRNSVPSWSKSVTNCKACNGNGKRRIACWARRGLGGQWAQPHGSWEKRPQKSLVTDSGGGLLRAVVAPANVNDDQLLQQTIEAMVVERPRTRKKRIQHLLLDKGDDTPTGDRGAAQKLYVAHIRRKGEVPIPKAQRTYPPRGWVVESSFAWLSKCRALLVRHDKDSQH